MTLLNVLVALCDCLQRILAYILSVTCLSKQKGSDMLICKQFLNGQLWIVLFNANKTLSMVISRKINPVQHPHLFTKDIIIAETTSHKHLCLTFSSTCTGTEHRNNISLKASIRLNLLRVLKFRVGKLYISFIRLLLE